MRDQTRPTGSRAMLARAGIAAFAALAVMAVAQAQLPKVGKVIEKVTKGSKVPSPTPSPTSTASPSPAAQPVRRGPEKPGARVPGTETSQGITGPMHQAHLGQVVFTRTDLAMNAITEASLVSSFTLGEDIFFRAYLRQPAVDTILAKGATAPRERVAMFTHYRARFTVAGQAFEADFDRWGRASDHASWTTWRGQLYNRDRNRRATVPGSEVLRELLGRATLKGLMGVGSHKIAMELTPLTIDNDGRVTALGEVVAKGEFTLAVSPASYNRNDPLVCTFPAAQSNPVVEQQVLTLARNVRDARATLVPSKVRVIQPEWTIERHPVTGIIIRRHIEATVLGKGPQYCGARSFTYIQPYVGGGFSAASGELGFAEFDEQPMPCQCLG